MLERPRALIVGCGYVGRRLARALNTDHTLYGIVRSTAHIRTLRGLRVEPVVVDLDSVTHREISSAWYRSETIFYLAPPAPIGESDSRLHRFLNALTDHPSTLVYISTTGVYGNLQGGVATESMTTNPRTERARRRASAEEISRVWCHEHAVRRVVLRVPAIYGPDRLPLDRLRSQEPAIIESEAPIINRIHVDDLVQAIKAGALNEDARGIYNVSDGNSLTMTEYLNRVAVLANLPPPTQITLEHAHIAMTEGMLSYMEESRRIDNSRMVNELGVKLQFSNVEEGIRASLREEALSNERRAK